MANAVRKVDKGNTNMRGLLDKRLLSDQVISYFALVDRVVSKKIGKRYWEHDDGSASMYPARFTTYPRNTKMVGVEKENASEFLSFEKSVWFLLIGTVCKLLSKFYKDLRPYIR